MVTLAVNTGFRIKQVLAKKQEQNHPITPNEFERKLVAVREAARGEPSSVIKNPLMMASRMLLSHGRQPTSSPTRWSWKFLTSGDLVMFKLGI